MNEAGINLGYFNKSVIVIQRIVSQISCIKIYKSSVGINRSRMPEVDRSVLGIGYTQHTTSTESFIHRHV